MTRKYTAFTPAFKLQTLALANKPNTCIAQFARDLGIRRNASFSGYHKERFFASQKK